jgi:hypothetical protein
MKKKSLNILAGEVQASSISGIYVGMKTWSAFKIFEGKCCEIRCWEKIDESDWNVGIREPGKLFYSFIEENQFYKLIDGKFLRKLTEDELIIKDIIE